MRLRTALLALLLSLVHCRERATPSGPPSAEDAAPSNSGTAPPPDPDAGGPLVVAPVARTVVPFALHRPPWGGTEKSMTETTSAQPVYLPQFFPDCRDPVPISRWTKAGKAGRSLWDVTAYRCAGEIPGRVLPSWESDGSFFVYGGRRDVVIELDSRAKGGPTPSQWRSYIDKAIANLLPSTPKFMAPAPTAPVDRKKAKAFMAKLQKAVGASLALECAHEQDGGNEQRALGAEMDRVIPSNQGNFEQVLHDVLICRICSRDTDRCSAALESVEAADAWVEKYAK
ncbi:hypothetical protein LVJ94_48650 [Pendulispora rubella]|uniref:Uncharacterized protein n=1 Tax=Pendulispora rubella TaxID=2741070 RepID=A0ABZ2L457_9BACT